MTKDRTLKNIINTQRETIRILIEEKQSAESLNRYYEDKIVAANKILDDFYNGRILYAKDLYKELRKCLSQEEKGKT